METLPKLRIKLPSENEARDICGLEEAKHRFNWGHEFFLVAVEGKVVNSYDELLAFAGQDRFKGREFLEVELEPLLAGG
jgi:hypothetical protein